MKKPPGVETFTAACNLRKWTIFLSDAPTGRPTDRPTDQPAQLDLHDVGLTGSRLVHSPNWTSMQKVALRAKLMICYLSEIQAVVGVVM